MKWGRHVNLYQATEFLLASCIWNGQDSRHNLIDCPTEWGKELCNFTRHSCRVCVTRGSVRVSLLFVTSTAFQVVIADSQKCINSSTFWSRQWDKMMDLEKRPVFTWCWGRCVNLYQAIRAPSCHFHMWPAERKPGTSCKYWIRVRDDFICTGRFSVQLRLLHQGVTASAEKGAS